MEHVWGLAVLVAAGGVVWALTIQQPLLKWPLAAAFALRGTAALVNFYIWPLPESDADPKRLEHLAWLFSQKPLETVQNFESFSFLYSAFMGAIYMVTGRAPLVLLSLSVLFGCLCVFLAARLGKELWSDRTVLPVAWFAALFPPLVLYSATIMREVYIVAALLLGLIFVARWIARNDHGYAAAAILSFLGGALFHAGLLIAVVVVLAVLVAQQAYLLRRKRATGEDAAAQILLLISVGAAVAVLIIVNPSLPKFGYLSGMFDPAKVVAVAVGRAIGNAAYPDWVLPGSAVDLLWSVPLHLVYLLLSPFFWEVTSNHHLIGTIDGLVYLFLLVLIAFNYRAILHNRPALVVGLIVLVLLIAFGIGTGNFGTALRHRAKFAPVLCVLAAPAMLRFVLEPLYVHLKLHAQMLPQGKRSPPAE